MITLLLVLLFFALALYGVDAVPASPRAKQVTVLVLTVFVVVWLLGGGACSYLIRW